MTHKWFDQLANLRLKVFGDPNDVLVAWPQYELNVGSDTLVPMRWLLLPSPFSGDLNRSIVPPI